MDLNSLFSSVTNAISDHHQNQQSNDDGNGVGGLLGRITGLFQQHADATNQPLDTGGILPASQDPYGDPADQNQGGQSANILPASMDPLGDPADQ